MLNPKPHISKKRYLKISAKKWEKKNKSKHVDKAKFSETISRDKEGGGSGIYAPGIPVSGNWKRCWVREEDECALIKGRHRHDRCYSTRYKNFLCVSRYRNTRCSKR